MTKIENKSDFTMSVQRLLTNSIVREEATKRGSGKHPSPKLFRQVALRMAKAVEKHFKVHFYQVRLVSSNEIALIIRVSHRSPIYLLYNYGENRYYPYSVGRIVQGRKLSDKIFIEFARYVCLRRALENLIAPSTGGDYATQVRHYSFHFC